MEIPVYLINGMLDAGKTSFINGVLQDGFAQEDATLLICCEEGEAEYRTSPEDNLTVVTVEDESQLTCAWLKQLEAAHHPAQVIIEYNGMWGLTRLEEEVLPSNWLLYQVMTVVESSTFEVYARNMGQLMMEKLISADMIVFNRCTPALAEALRRRNLRMVNRRAEMFLEYEDRSTEPYVLGDDSPFDLDQPVIRIKDEDYGLWYVDIMEHLERYHGKTVQLKLMMCHVPQYADVAIPGRFAMVCCEDDVTFLGVVALGAGMERFSNRDWVEVTAEVEVGTHPAYGDTPGPLLHISSISPCQAPENQVITF